MLVPPSHWGHLYATVAASLASIRPPNERRAIEPIRRPVKVSKTPRILGLPLRHDFPLPLDPIRESARVRVHHHDPSPVPPGPYYFHHISRLQKFSLPSLPYLSDERASMPCSPSSGDHNSEGSAAFLSLDSAPSNVTYCNLSFFQMLLFHAFMRLSESERVQMGGPSSPSSREHCRSLTVL